MSMKDLSPDEQKRINTFLSSCRMAVDYAIENKVSHMSDEDYALLLKAFPIKYTDGRNSEELDEEALFDAIGLA